ncbi:MAG TPA: dihydrofolate reductase [Patescibacteria group bacterium]|nr:dihydrofolate reductase [Patescibacteria group bacterium]
MISMIAAIGNKRELGEGNGLIWKIPDDLQRLKSLTSGHSIIMGRKTFESIGRPLPNRTNIIVTRDANSYVSSHPELVSGSHVETPDLVRGDKGIVVNSIEDAIEIAKRSPGAEEIFIFGGSQIYTQAIKLADKLYLTRINSEAPMADAFFPDYSEFTNVILSEPHEYDSLQYEFVELTKPQK